MPTIKMCTTGLLMKQRTVGPGPNQSKFKHLLLTILDREGGGLIWGGEEPSGGCSRVEPWDNVTDDMAKNHVQKHCVHLTGRVINDKDRHDQNKCIITNLDLINLY